MKIVLFLTNSLRGLYSFRKELVQAYIKHNLKVYISCPLVNCNYEYKWFKEIGCEIINTKFNRRGLNPVADLRLLLGYYRIIKNIRPDIVLSYTIKPNIYGGIACALLSVPQLANVTGLGTAVEYPGIMQKLTILLYKIGFRKTRLVFFQNEENLQFCISNKMVKGATRLIPGSGVNLEYHSFKQYPKENQSVRFIFISRIRREKGIEEYLAAAKIVKQEHPEVEFHVLGSCEENYIERLEMLQKKGIIIYHGHQMDVRPFIANIHCTIHPTFYPEGMSNVLLESCALGRAIITTDRAGCREIVEDGVNGYIVKQQDTKDLVEKIEKFLALSYEAKCQMGLAARKIVEQKFDRKLVVNAYLEECEIV